MGLRHQAYIIAKVIPSGGDQPLYRCMGGWHIQNCQNDTAVRAARRLISLLRQPDNAAIVREELQSISGQYDARVNEPQLMCPYSMFLLAVSFSFAPYDDPEGGVYASGTSFEQNALEASSPPSAGDNNTGITVVDITNPQIPEYCFVSISGDSSCEPFSAGDWDQGDSGFWDDDDDTDPNFEPMKNVYESMEKEVVMNRSALEEAWPGDFEPNLNAVESSKGGPVLPTIVPAVMEPALEEAVKQAIETGNMDTLQPLLSISDKWIPIRAALANYDPLPGAAVDLIAKALDNTSKILDLSSLKILPDGIAKILSQCNGHALNSLNLSLNLNVTKDVLRSLLEAYPHIQSIILFGTGIKDEEMDDLLTQHPRLFRNVRQVIHPAYLTREERPSYPNAFTFDGFNSRRSTRLAIPFFNPTMVIQMVSEYLDIQTRDIKNSMVPNLLQCPVAVMAIFSRYGEKEIPWTDRGVGFVPTSGQNLAERKGWTFIFHAEQCRGMMMNFDSPFSNVTSHYSFVRVGAGGKREIYDLDSFVQVLKSEGMEPDEGVVRDARVAFRNARVALKGRVTTRADLEASAYEE